MSQANENVPTYIVKQPEGTYLPQSRDTPGALRAIAFSDDENKLVGPVELIEAKPAKPSVIYIPQHVQPRQSERVAHAVTESIGDALVDLIHNLVAELTPYVEIWVKNVAVPSIVRKFREIAAARKFHEAATKQKTTAIDTIPPSMLSPTTLAVNLDDAYEKYRKNVSSEEAQRRLVKIALHSAILAVEIREFANACVGQDSTTPEEDLEWRKLIEKLTTQEVTTCINSILSNNISLMDEKRSTSLSKILGYDLISDGQFVPIENDRFRAALTV